MKLKRQVMLFWLIIVMGMPYNLFSQAVQTKPSRQSSFEAFSQGNFEKAYSEFSELLTTYSKDPLYKYYSGVCLVKMNKLPEKAIDLLQDALQSAGTVKTLPSDGLFYLGRAQQMAGKFTDASESYNRYTEHAGKKSAKALGVPEYLHQCSERKGQLAPSENLSPEASIKIKSDSLNTEVKTLPKAPDKSPKQELIKNAAILPETYEKVLSEAVEYQFKADSVSTIAEAQKKEIDKHSGPEKAVLSQKLSDNEKLAAGYQSAADRKYRAAELLMNKGRDTASQKNAVTAAKEPVVVKDTVKKETANPAKIVEKRSDTSPRISNPGVPVLSIFEAIPNPVTDPKAKIAIDPDIPEGLTYRIQVAVFRNPVAPSYFKGLTPVYGFRIAGTDKTNYYVGIFRHYSDASKALVTVKGKGFKDAFVIALSGKKTVSADRAAMLEKEWGNKSLIADEMTLPEVKADTIPPTLIFRVEVMRTLKPLKEETVEEIRKLAGNRGLDIETLEDGNIAYLIGKFITFDTAAEYSDLLVRNGYREAKVVAWLGSKEIPIETAKRLFDKLK